jgi:hypothetical protein
MITLERFKHRLARVYLYCSRQHYDETLRTLDYIYEMLQRGKFNQEIVDLFNDLEFMYLFNDEEWAEDAERI